MPDSCVISAPFKIDDSLFEETVKRVAASWWLDYDNLCDDDKKGVRQQVGQHIQSWRDVLRASRPDEFMYRDVVETQKRLLGDNLAERIRAAI